MSEHIDVKGWNNLGKIIDYAAWKRLLNSKLKLESVHFKQPSEEEVNLVKDAMARNIAHQARGCYNFKKSLLPGGDPVLAELPCGFFMVTREEIISMPEHFRRLAHGQV